MIFILQDIFIVVFMQSVAFTFLILLFSSQNSTIEIVGADACDGWSAYLPCRYSFVPASLDFTNPDTVSTMLAGLGSCDLVIFSHVLLDVVVAQDRAITTGAERSKAETAECKDESTIPKDAGMRSGDSCATSAVQGRQQEQLKLRGRVGLPPWFWDALRAAQPTAIVLCLERCVGWALGLSSRLDYYSTFVSLISFSSLSLVVQKQDRALATAKATWSFASMGSSRQGPRRFTLGTSCPVRTMKTNISL